MEREQVKKGLQITQSIDSKNAQLSELTTWRGIDAIQLSVKEPGSLTSKYQVTYDDDLELLGEIKLRIEAKLQSEVKQLEDELKAL